MIRVSEEVAEALRAGDGVVALETTLVAHGFPPGEGIEVGLASELDDGTRDQADQNQLDHGAPAHPLTSLIIPSETRRPLKALRGWQRVPGTQTCFALL